MPPKWFQRCQTKIKKILRDIQKNLRKFQEVSINVKKIPKEIGKTLGDNEGAKKMSKRCRTMPKRKKKHGGTWKTHLTTLRKCWN